MDTAIDWVVLEGIVPIFGAGLLYILLGIGKKITIRAGRPFSYNWRDSLDPIGWLYAGAVVASAIGMKTTSGVDPKFRYACLTCGFFCVLLLIAAFHSKADDPTWEPPPVMSWVAGLLVIVILAAGFWVKYLSNGGGHTP
jgi:hypothetical protein